MSRKKLYPNDAERQRAHRQRVKARLAGLLPVSSPPGPQRKKTRPQRIGQIANDLRDLADEYQGWLDGLPANLAGGGIADRLQETIDGLQEACDTVDALEPPRGFGR